ncbi:TPA: NAD(P)H-binding protein [Elizabethkingia anophelis]|nr:NAD(P)H-binding protein [Elizabethkingia anophelis]HBN6703087.1 NAD(P)H-binding protein [Elizabethkingia anophelis]HBN6706898.1 NAD(P)H-binding protein [Elizabethkingia anophelis]HBN6710930.1 NAD(P)H-binding protein [Elizabethkingia anophelis]HBN6715045.1 NAD(P)H-binding protein [Elizabethkingia anophelis]
MKSKVLILGANGAIAQYVIAFLSKKENIELTLFARDSKHIKQFETSAKIIEGDVLNTSNLNEAIKGQDIIYANLSGAVDKMAKEIVSTMDVNSVKRLIFVTSLGIYKEVAGKFGEWNERMIGSDLIPYRKAADSIEKSNLDYTIVRPSWLTDKDETDYETTQKGEPFTGTEVARKAVAAYITHIIENPEEDVKASIGVHKPGVYGDKPAFY